MPYHLVLLKRAVRLDPRPVHLMHRRGYSVSRATLPGAGGRNGHTQDDAAWKYPIYSSERMKEKKSVFLAHATTLPSPVALTPFLDHLTSLPALKRATHCMYAYRVISDPLRAESSKMVGQHDGGEKGSGERLSRLLEALECENAIVVVSRWYGGVKLGSDRWKMISSVAKDALRKGNFTKEKASTTAVSNKMNLNKKQKKR